jgi:ketosteroid isomerase-like protein
MREKNLELTRIGYDAFAKGDLAAFRDLFTPDIVWRTIGMVFEPEHKGVDAVLGYFTRLYELSDGTFTLDVEHMLGDDERVMVIQRVKAMRAGNLLDTHLVLVFEIHDGRVWEVTEFAAEPAKLMAFWS